MDYTVSLTSAQQKAMEYVAADVDAWIQNAVANRIRKSTEEITSIYTQTKIANNEAITAVGAAAIITAAFNENIVKTAAQRAADIEAADAAQQAALGG